MDMFMAPIPGQSLTDTPKNYPWERPPETVDPNEAIMMYIDHLSQPTVIDDLLYVLEFGIPVKTITESIITGGTANGWHNIDLGLIITPVVYEYIISIAKEAGANYKEKFGGDERENVIKNRGKSLLKAALEEAPEGSDFQYLEELAAAEEPAEEEPMEEEPKGLMSRRG